MKSTKMKERKSRGTPGRLPLQMVSLLLVLVLLLVVAPIDSAALTINGEGNGIGGATSTADGEYMATGGLEAVGYRFTLVDSSGTTVANTDPYDVYKASQWSSYISGRNVACFPTKYSKMELISRYRTLVTSGFSTVSVALGTYTVRDSDWGLSFPASAMNMPTWATKSNITTVMLKAWNYAVGDLATYKLSVVIEPIYSVKMGGEFVAGTVTELAILAVADGTAYTATSGLWDDVPNNTTDADSWSFISGYTHAEWPMSLHLEKNTTFGVNKPSKTLSKADKVRGSSEQIIVEGYGMMVVDDESLGISSSGSTNPTTPSTPNTTLTINYYSNYATGGVSGLKNTPNGSNVLVRTWTVNYGDTVDINLHDYSYSSAATYLYRTGYSATGIWNTKSDGTGIGINQATSYPTSQALAAALGVSIENQSQTVNVYAQWIPYTLTINYYSNYATGGVSGLKNTPNGSNVLVRTWILNYGATEDINLHDYTYSSAATYLYRTGHSATGIWNTKSDGTGIGINQATSYPTSQALAAALGVSIENQSQTVNVYAQWTPYTLTINYYSNYATGGASGLLTTPNGNNVLVRTVALKYGTTDISLHDYSYSSAATYLYRTGYSATGIWNTKSDGTGRGVNEATSYSTSQALAAALGVSIENQNQTVNVYAQWTPNGVLTINPNGGTYSGLVITKQPASVCVANGEQAVVTVEAQGSGLTYEWYYSEKGSTTFYKTTSFTGNKYDVAMNSTRDGRRLYCVVTDSLGSSVQTDVVTISMSSGSGLVITRQPASVCVANGEQAVVTVEAKGSGLTYEWYYSEKGSTTFYKTTSFTGNKYDVEMNSTRDGRRLYCVVTDSSGNSVQTNIVTIRTTGVTMPSGETYVVADPVRAGYTFTGWTHSGGGTWTSSSDTYKFSTTDGTLTANWSTATYTNTIAFYVGEFKNQEGNSSTKNWWHLGDTEFTAASGSSFVLDSTRSIEVPNGHYLMTSFGTSGITGTWTRYDFPYTVTQPARDLWIEYDMAATKYNITYNLNGGTNNSANPSTYNIHYGVSLKNPTKTGYTFTGWTATTASQNVSISANSSNYHYTSLLRNLVPGTTYTLNINTAKVTSGSASVFSVKIYDFTANTTLATQDNISFGSNVSLSMLCPASANASHDIQMIIYSGKSGSTANVATSYSGLTVSYPTTGINEGADLEFVRTATSADTFYEQMDTRQTGNLTLTANWTQNAPTSYTITYKYGSDTIDTQTYTSSDSVTLRGAYTLSGYTFTGWKLSVAVGNWTATTYSASQNVGTGKSGNITLYAQMEAAPTTYTITCNKQNGSGGTSTFYETYGTRFYTTNSSTGVTSITVPTRSGYTFGGYYTSTNGGGTQIVDASGNIKVTNTYFTSDATIYAKWTANAPTTYTITCDKQSGSGGTSTFYETYGTRFYTTNSSTGVTSITVPTRSGYTFGGYYTSTNGGGTQIVDASGNIKVTNTYFTSNATIYAKWTSVPTHTLTVIPNGGVWNGQTGEQSITLVEGDTLYIPLPTRDGYTFNKWAVTGGGSLSSTTSAATYTQGNSDCTIVAQWIDNTPVSYTITYKYGSEIIATQNYSSSDSVTLRDAYTLSGYTFTGWKLSVAVGNWAATTYNASQNVGTGKEGNVILYAQMVAAPTTYTITCNKQNGSGGTSTFYETYGTRFYTLNPNTGVTSITVPTRTGYTFGGYYTSTNGGGTQIVDASGNIKVANTYFTSDATIYAKWTANAPTTYTVTWKNYNGTVLETDTGVAYGTTPTYNGSTPTRSSTVYYTYTFSGWSPAISPVTGDVTYTAQFTETLRTYLQRVYVRYQAVDGSWGTYSLVISQYYGYGESFSGWSRAADTTYQAASLAGYTVTGAKDNYVDVYRQQYTVTLTKGTGISSVSGAGTYYAGATVTLGATPSTNYSWYRWTQTSGGAQVSTTNAYSFTINNNVSYTANATYNAPTTYTVTWVNYNGTVLETDTGVAYGTTPTYNGSTPTRSSTAYYTYTFSGWSPAISPVTGDITYTAQFTETPRTYTIYCDTQSGTGGTAAFFEIYGIRFYISNSATAVTSISVPTRTGYTFGGYYTSTNGGGTQIVDASGKIMVANTYFTSNTTIYAKWTPTSYTITYKYGSTTIATSTYTIEDAITLRAAYSLTGYTFSCWNISTAVGNWSTGNYNASQSINAGKYGNVTLNAVMVAVNYKITYDENGGSAVADLSYNIGTSVTLANAPTREGYKFTGWKLSAAVGNWSAGNYNAKQSIGTGKYGNITLVAQWEKAKTYTVVYDGNGATDGTMDDDILVVGQPSELSPNEYERPGYNFDGWNTKPDGSGDSYEDGETVTDLSTTDGDEVTLYAQWEPYKMTVIYHSNGATSIKYYGATITDATLQTKTHVFEYGTSYPNGLLNTNNPDAMYLTRTAYNLTGYWLVDSANSSKKISQDMGGTAEEIANAMGKTIKNGSITVHVYAEWTPVTYTISYNSNGGSAVASQNYNVTTNVTLAAAPTRAGYDFAGWKLSTAAGNWTTGTYSAKQNIGTGKYGNITLVAQWTPRYDVALTEILLSYSDAAHAMNASERASIMAGKTVYVYYVITNYSPVATNVTAYNNSGNAITYNGSTSYAVTAGGTLTIPAGSFMASTPGATTYSGSVYLAGYKDASPETDDGTNNVNQTSYEVKLDLGVKEIYLTDADGNRIDASSVPLNTEVKIHVVYENLSNMAFTVNGYYNGNQITYNGTRSFSVPANSSVDVVVSTFTTPSVTGTVSVNASVYRDGKTAATEKNETTLTNNTKSLTYSIVDNIELPTLEPIDPGAAYREGTEVITSYWLHNTGRLNYTTANAVTVRMRMYDSVTGNLVAEMTQKVVVPAGETQLVYFKWTVPDMDVCGEFRSVADLHLATNDTYIGEVEHTYDCVEYGVYFTPDTQYEDKQPDYWTKPVKPTTVSDTATWYQWEYKNGSFTKKEYGITVSAGASVLTPTSVTAYEKDGVWYMKSGYGFTVIAGDVIVSAASGSELPNASAYTLAQYVYANYPEFGYSMEQAFTDSMEYVNGIWQLYEFESYGRVHFTPIWYPDGDYYAKVTQSDIWTPMGMLKVSSASSRVIIEGDMYDDWYTN